MNSDEPTNAVFARPNQSESYAFVVAQRLSIQNPAIPVSDPSFNSLFSVLADFLAKHLRANKQ
jgi:hypothetical protein